MRFWIPSKSGQSNNLLLWKVDAMKNPALFETMTPEEFRARRRQKYLNLEYYRLNQKDLDESIKGQLELIERDKAEGDPSPSGQSGVFGYKLDLLKLHYTAGEPIEELKPYYAEVLKAWKVYLDAHAKYVLYLEKKFGDELEKTKPPLIFEDVECFRQVMELVGLALLLGDGVALRQLVHDFRYYRHTDMLYEALITPAVPDPDKETTEYFHEVPYSPLIDAFLVGTTQEAAGASIRQYLKSWYKAFDGTGWHNGHLDAVPGQYMPYQGYWPFDAAAIAVLYDIDDTPSRSHLLYAKDFADWARENKSVERIRPIFRKKPQGRIPAKPGRDMAQGGRASGKSQGLCRFRWQSRRGVEARGCPPP
ncbi:MAG: DUF1911 domain-containing protein [Zoogloeaceae bacterium]|jgi:hypothetical protein|nr:DUF1911 domain-containing protein [Zoogloeaceae bacterium]